MRRTTFLLAITAVMSTSVVAFGQIPANTTFFDYDFTATDQITAEFGNADGVFTGNTINRGPFVDGPLASQVGFNNSIINQNLDVDTAGGFAAETPTSTMNFQTGNLFIGQPLVSVGDTVRLISELSFTKNLIDDASNPGSMVEANSQFDNFFFGFRGGAGTNEFAPNEGVSQTFRYSLGADNSIDSDSVIQAFINANAISAATPAGDGNIATAPVTSLGIDIANGDFETDVFRIVSDAVVTAADATTITFEITTTIEDQAGNVLGTTPATTTAVDTGIALASNRIQFAIRDGNSGPNDPSELQIHRLAVIFNPEDSMALKGDVDLSGAVDFADIPAFISVLQGGSFQAEADCDCNTAVDFADIPAFIAILQGG